MRVALVNLWRVLNAYGGTERVFFNMANALVERGYSVTTIVSDDGSGEPVFPIDPRVDFKNIPVSSNKFWFKSQISHIFSREARHQKRNMHSLQRKAKAIAGAISELNPDVLFHFNKKQRLY